MTLIADMKPSAPKALAAVSGEKPTSTKNATSCTITVNTAVSAKKKTWQTPQSTGVRHADDEEIELPEIRKASREEEGTAHAGEARGVHPARADAVEDQADERRGAAVHQEVDRIDAGQLRARPAVVALERQDEHHV